LLSIFAAIVFLVNMTAFLLVWVIQGKHVPGNDIYAANIVQKRKYR